MKYLLDTNTRSLAMAGGAANLRVSAAGTAIARRCPGNPENTDILLMSVFSPAMPEPVVVPERIVAGMPQALRAELGHEAGHAAEVVAVSVPAGDVPDVVRVLRVLASRLSRRPALSESRTQALLAAIGTLDTPSNLVADLEVDNAILRSRYLDGQKTYTSREVRELSGLATRNPSEPASRWKRNRRIFGVPVGKQDRYPAFQFAEGRPRPEIARILTMLPADMSPWQTAFWFASSNRWIDDDNAPQEALHDIDRVLSAAANLASADIG